jgi:hypothetical protein
MIHRFFASGRMICSSPLGTTGLAAAATVTGDGMWTATAELDATGRPVSLLTAIVERVALIVPEAAEV